MKTLLYFIFSLLLLSVVSCSKFVDISPTDKSTKAVAFESVANASGAVNGMYADLSIQGNIYRQALCTSISLLSDELKTVSVSALPFAQNSVTPQLSSLDAIWQGYYAIINHANLVLDNLGKVPGLQPKQMDAWRGEAKFIRATAYMGLVQLFGKLPKVTSSLWANNEALSRSPVEEIYALIFQDLQDAKNSLPHDYQDPATDRVRATKGAASAMLTKYYMLRKDWSNAVSEATAVINDSATYSLETNFANVFHDNSVESILEIWYGSQAVNFLSSSFGIGGGRGATAQYSPSPQIIAAFTASSGDRRTAASIAGGKVSKYLSPTSRFKLLRLADIFLLRAEAQAQLGDTSKSLADLNRIRARAGVSPVVAIDQASLLLTIEGERNLELAFEGHRWFDLVRTGRADAVLSVLKPQTWQPTDVLLPIPQTEINLNAALLPQNPPF